MTFLYQFKSTEEKKDENIRYIMLARGIFSSLATEDGRSITITSGFAFILHVRSLRYFVQVIREITHNHYDK